MAVVKFVVLLGVVLVSVLLIFQDAVYARELTEANGWYFHVLIISSVFAIIAFFYLFVLSFLHNMLQTVLVYIYCNFSWFNSVTDIFIYLYVTVVFHISSNV
jgi:hypothetical protein